VIRKKRRGKIRHVLPAKDLDVVSTSVPNADGKDGDEEDAAP
jgi:hypothetical protein